METGSSGVVQLNLEPTRDGAILAQRGVPISSFKDAAIPSGRHALPFHLEAETRETGLMDLLLMVADQRRLRIAIEGNGLLRGDPQSIRPIGAKLLDLGRSILACALFIIGPREGLDRARWRNREYGYISF